MIEQAAAELLVTSMEVATIRMASLMSMKSIDTYGRRLRGLTRGLWAGEIDRYTFEDSIFRLIRREFNNAWTEGAATQGVEAEERTPEEEAKLQELINSQAAFIPGLADYILAHSETIDPMMPSPFAVEAPPDPFTATVVEPAAPLPTGTGETFTDSVSYRESKNSWEFDEAVKKMDNVIGTGEADFDVKMSFTRDIKGHGEYNNNTKKVRIKHDVSGNEMVTLHELGHAIDKELMMRNLGLEDISGTGISMRIIPETDELWEAMYNSKGIQVLQEARDSLDDNWFDYALGQNEIWARGFSQYVAEKTQDEGLLWELGNIMEDDMYPSQWTSKDFRPIAKAFDNLFKAAGMLL